MKDATDRYLLGSAVFALMVILMVLLMPMDRSTPPAEHWLTCTNPTPSTIDCERIRTP